MNRIVALAALALAFLATLAFTTPLRLALALAPIEGLTADAVSGSIWNGRLQNTRLGGLRLGELRVGASLWSLAHPGPALRFETRGAIRADGLAVTSGSARGLAGVTGSAPIEALGLGLPLKGSLSVTDATLLLRAGACARARGGLATDALSAGAEALQWRGPALAGEFSCGPEGELLGTMAGEDETGRAAAELRLFADGRYVLDLRIAPAEADAAQGLALAGFQQTSDGYARRIEGQWRPRA